MEDKTIAGKQLITVILKKENWEIVESSKQNKDNNLLMQKVEDPYITDENAQVYLAKDIIEKLFKNDIKAQSFVNILFNESLVRITTWNGYIEAYIADKGNLKDILVDIPITLIQDRNEGKIMENLDKYEKENKKDE